MTLLRKNDVLSSEGPRSAGGAQGPNAGKDGTDPSSTRLREF